LLAAGLAIRVASIPNGKDPDDFIKENGGEAFREIVSKAEGFFDWYLKRLCVTNETRTDKGRVTVLREFGEALAKTRNAVLIDTHAQMAALRLGVSVESVRAELKKTRVPERREDGDSNDEPMGEDTSAGPPPPRESQLLKLVVSGGEHVRFAIAHLDQQWLKHPVVKRIVQHYDPTADEPMPAGAALLAQFQNDLDAQNLLSTVFTDPQPTPQTEKEIIVLLTHMRTDFINAELLRLLHRATHPETDAETQRELFTQQRRLRDLREQPLGLSSSRNDA